MISKVGLQGPALLDPGVSRALRLRVGLISHFHCRTSCQVTSHKKN